MCFLLAILGLFIMHRIHLLNASGEIQIKIIGKKKVYFPI